MKMLMPVLGILGGLVLLVWSADKFVSGAAATASFFSLPPLLIGMIIVGFGTSAPEMVVSAMAASQGNPGLALGNAYGSNIANIGLILGVTALICPIVVQSQVVKKEIPILIGITALAAYQLIDGSLSLFDAAGLLLVFAGLLGWSIYESTRKRDDAFATEMAAELESTQMPLRRAVFWIVAGLVLLIASSRLLVWGSIEIAHQFGVSDLIIGLTIVAVGTSLPELASSLAAARKNEPDIALGNVIGSNLFNTLVVVGIAGTIHPLAVPPEVLSRDLLVVGFFTLALLAVCTGIKKPGRITRIEGMLLIAAYAGYTAWLAKSALGL